jgi:pimeloyl-ACP methyl ester carboxylesterase
VIPAGILIPLFLSAATGIQANPIGRLVDLGGHRLHVHCIGRGSPTVVVENGFDEFSFDWVLVQQRLAGITRTCTYDRAGYAWSNPGPKPRTFAQICLELREALSKLGEGRPYVLVGHSFGGGAVRYFAEAYPRDVAGIVLVESIEEEQRIPIQGKAVRLRDLSEGKTIPAPHLDMPPPDQPVLPSSADLSAPAALEPPFDRLPADTQRLHRWAESQPSMQDARASEGAWSPEYFALWHARPQEGSLGHVPLLVLTRAEGGYGDNLDVPAAQLDSERKERQAHLAGLSSNGNQRIIRAGHNMQLEAPDDVAEAIEEVIHAVRHRTPPGWRSPRP